MLRFQVNLKIGVVVEFERQKYCETAYALGRNAEICAVRRARRSPALGRKSKCLTAQQNRKRQVNSIGSAFDESSADRL
eukprot:6211327-Pleurochrysis_carterae.AAC.1